MFLTDEQMEFRSNKQTEMLEKYEKENGDIYDLPPEKDREFKEMWEQLTIDILNGKYDEEIACLTKD